MDESSNSNSLMALANKSKHYEITSNSPPFVHELGESFVDQMEMSSIARSIEKSKSHWSQVQEFDSTHEEAKVSNMELFQTLQRHSSWGGFFKTFGEIEGSRGELLIGKKFAEGGQAELYEVQINWNRPIVIELDQKHKYEYVLKVFKKGILLQHLQSQWPQGMLQHYADMKHCHDLGLTQKLRFHCAVHSATLLEDERFAFIMVKEDKDLRSMKDELIVTRPKSKGPFSKDFVELIIYQIVCGMDQLHSEGIVHRDIKASNVLYTRGHGFHVADFECSIGVVGTGFFRAPEVLEACKHGNVNKKVEFFTKAVDVYAYGMTCYEVLTGKLSFEGHPRNEYDFVFHGERPKLPHDVDDWIRKLLERCWHRNPLARPSFSEILEILVANSRSCKKQKLIIEKHEVEVGIMKESTMAKMRRSLRMVKLKLIG